MTDADQQTQLLTEIRDLLREEVRLRERALAEQGAAMAAQQAATGRMLLAFLAIVVLWFVGATLLPRLVG